MKKIIKYRGLPYLPVSKSWRKEIKAGRIPFKLPIPPFPQHLSIGHSSDTFLTSKEYTLNL